MAEILSDCKGVDVYKKVSMMISPCDTEVSEASREYFEVNGAARCLTVKETELLKEERRVAEEDGKEKMGLRIRRWQEQESKGVIR